MKKLFAFILIVLISFSLVSCQGAGSGYLFEETAIGLTLRSFAFDEGVLYIENENPNIGYVDFESGESTVFCSLPSCTHTDASCPANFDNMVNYFVAGDSFYHMQYSLTTTSATAKLDLYQSDMNRQNEKVIASFEGDLRSEIVYHENAVYMYFARTLESEDLTSLAVPQEHIIMGYDLKGNKVLGEGVIVSGYDAEVSKVLGIHEGKIIYITTRFEEAIEWGELSEEEVEEISGKRIYEYASVDMNSMEVEKGNSVSELLKIDIDAPDPQYISDGILFYNKDEKLNAYDIAKNENEVILEMPGTGFGKAGDKVIFIDYPQHTQNYLFDPVSKEVEKIYAPKDGDWLLGGGYLLWHEYDEHIYMGSANIAEDEGEYGKGSPFIIKVNKEDIYKESYEAEVVS